VELDNESFDGAVDGSKPAFVMFYAEWCGHCKSFKPDYERVGEAFQGSDVVIAKVNADTHRELGERFNIEGFPTLKYFPKSFTKPEDYEGQRTTEGVIEFINSRAGTKVKVKGAAPSQVKVLTPDNFNSLVLDANNDALVEFYAPWCGHCKKLAPVYDVVGNAFVGEKNVVIGKVDCDAHKELCQSYGVSGYPTLKFFSRINKDGIAYDGGREAGDLLYYVNTAAGTHRLMNGFLSDKAGLVTELSALSNQFVDASTDERTQLLNRAMKLSEEHVTSSGKIYVRYMESVIERGTDFIKTEVERLQRMVDSKSMTAQKIDEFTIRLNILNTF